MLYQPELQVILFHNRCKEITPCCQQKEPAKINHQHKKSTLLCKLGTKQSLLEQKTSSTENAVHNVAEPLGKIANNNLGNKETINQHGRKEKASYETKKTYQIVTADKNEDDIQGKDDKANNSDDDDNNNNNNNSRDDVSQSGFLNASSDNQQNEETHDISHKTNICKLDQLQKNSCMKMSCFIVGEMIWLQWMYN